MLTIRAGFIGVGVELVVGFQTSARVCSQCSFDSNKKTEVVLQLSLLCIAEVIAWVLT